MTRRAFLERAACAGAMASLARPARAAGAMYISLNGSLVNKQGGPAVAWPEFVRLAGKVGYGGVDVSGNAVLRGFGQIVRQQQQALGAQALGFLRHLDGHAGRAANASQDRYGLLAGIHGSLDHGAVFIRRQGEELASTAGSEQSGSTVRCQPLEAADVASLVEITGSIEVGHRERQQTGGEDGLKFLWIHYANTL